MPNAVGSALISWWGAAGRRTSRLAAPGVGTDCERPQAQRRPHQPLALVSADVPLNQALLPPRSFPMGPRAQKARVRELYTRRSTPVGQRIEQAPSKHSVASEAVFLSSKDSAHFINIHTICPYDREPPPSCDARQWLGGSGVFPGLLRRTPRGGSWVSDTRENGGLVAISPCDEPGGRAAAVAAELPPRISSGAHETRLIHARTRTAAAPRRPRGRRRPRPRRVASPLSGVPKEDL